MIAFKALSDSEPALEHSPMLKAALLTIEYIELNGPIGLTPAKALKRYFVAWAAEMFAWPNYSAEDLYAYNKVLNEQDFPPLAVLHDVLISAKLVRHYKGAMHLTKLAKAMRATPAELWRLVATHLLCVVDHSQYTRFGDQMMRSWDIFLNVINVEAQQGATEGRLCSVLFGGAEMDYRAHEYRLAATFYIHVLRPLTWAGLMQEHRTGRGLQREEIFTKSPLWAAALDMDTDHLLETPTRH